METFESFYQITKHIVTTTTIIIIIIMIIIIVLLCSILQLSSKTMTSSPNDITSELRDDSISINVNVTTAEVVAESLRGRVSQANPMIARFFLLCG